MELAGWLLMAFLIMNVIFGFLLVVFVIRMWDLVTQASEFFARENQRFRREYERRQRPGP